MNLLNELKHYHSEIESPFGHTNDAIPPAGGVTLLEGRTLYALVRMFKSQFIIESGTHMGNSAWFMMQALQKNSDEGITGVLTTIDKLQLPGMLVRGNAFVHDVEFDIIAWMKTHENQMKVCDFFNHDDDHGTDHIMEEMSILDQYKPKVITIHDSQTESLGFWEMVMKTPDYMPEYDRYEVKSLMGVGLLIKKGVSI